MYLDPLTLMFPGAIATAFAALLLFGAWWQYRETPALLWWSASNGLNAASIALMAAGFIMVSPLPTAVGAGLSSLAPVVVWAGVHHFNRRPVPWLVFAAGPVLWLAVFLAPFGHDNMEWSAMTGFALWSFYLPAAAWVLWKARSEPLIARWPLMGFLGLHALVYAGAAIETVTGTIELGGPPPVDSWFGMIHFETILYAMGTAFFMVLLCKERVELGYILAARIDPLTGTANRGAFFDHAHRILGRCRQDGSPFSLIMFDLDRFKSINDNYGHLLGDRILRDFAETVRLSLRPNDLFGRYGGEEFVVVLPGASIETAAVIAERVRQVFAELHEFVDGKPVQATVSAGVAVAEPAARLEEVIDAADKAMYAAKRSGRNRVERAPAEKPSGDSIIVRIA